MFIGVFGKIGSILGSGARAIGAALGYSSSFSICEILKSIDWPTCAPQIAYDKVEAKVKDWEHVVSGGV